MPKGSKSIETEIIPDPKKSTVQTKISPHGFPGSQCKSLTAGIEKALGAKVKDTLTDEYYDAGPKSQKTHNKANA